MRTMTIRFKRNHNKGIGNTGNRRPLQLAIQTLCWMILCSFLSGCGGGEGEAENLSNNIVGSSDLAGAKASLVWEAPETRADGQPLSDLAGFKVYYGILSPVGLPGTQVIDIGKATTYTVEGLDKGTYYFSVTAYDLAGNESDFSSEASTTIQ